METRASEPRAGARPAPVGRGGGQCGATTARTPATRRCGPVKLRNIMMRLIAVALMRPSAFRMMPCAAPPAIGLRGRAP